MEDVLKWLAWVGPLAVVAAALLLKGVRTALGLRRKDPGPAQALEQAEAPAPALAYEEQVRAQDCAAAAREAEVEAEIGRARQEAMRRAVEGEEFVVLTIRPPEAVPPGGATCTIEAYPADDPRRAAGSYPAAGLTVIDRRPLPDAWSEPGAGRLPRPLREAADRRRALREACYGAAALHAVPPAQPAQPSQPSQPSQPAQPAPVSCGLPPAPAYLSTGSPALEAKITEFEAYRRDLDARAAKAFDASLAEIKSWVEDQARNVWAVTPERQAAFADEALARGVPVAQVADEFAASAVARAVARARELAGPGGVLVSDGLLGALTGERLSQSDLFTHKPAPPGP